MDIQTWCNQQGITKANYYYRLRKVREACLEMTGENVMPCFVELESPAGDPTLSQESTASPAIIVLASGTRIELQENASSEFIKKLLGVLSHAQ